MKCKLCGKKSVQLAHWRTAHKDYMRRKASSPEARAKGARTRARHKAEEAGERSPRKRKRASSISPDAYTVASTVNYGGHYCPVCGQRH